MRTPIPTMMPTWKSAIKGRTPRTANTAANKIPALVMTPPVAPKALIIA